MTHTLCYISYKGTILTVYRRVFSAQFLAQHTRDIEVTEAGPKNTELFNNVACLER